MILYLRAFRSTAEPRVLCVVHSAIHLRLSINQARCLPVSCAVTHSQSNGRFQSIFFFLIYVQNMNDDGSLLLFLVLM